MIHIAQLRTKEGPPCDRMQQLPQQHHKDITRLSHMSNVNGINDVSLHIKVKCVGVISYSNTEYFDIEALMLC